MERHNKGRVNGADSFLADISKAEALTLAEKHGYDVMLKCVPRRIKREVARNKAKKQRNEPL